MDSETQSPGQLYYYRFICGGLSVDQACSLTGVSRTTYKRWEAGTQRITLAAFRLIKYLVAGYIQSEEWKNWRFINDGLYSPEDVRFSPGEIRALPYLHALIAELKNTKSKVIPLKINNKYIDVGISGNTRSSSGI